MKCGHETCPLLEISLIPLTQGKYAIVDTEDYDYLMQWKWSASRYRHTYYAQRCQYDKSSKRRRMLRIHSVIMVTPEGKDTDHLNHRGLDNRKHNLRVVSHGENLRNMVKRTPHSSIYKGVCWVPRTNSWYSNITYRYKTYHIGYFKDERDAAMAYDKKACELFGQFACLNFGRNDA